MKKLFTLFWIVMGILFLFNSSSYAQLSGTKNIPGDYATISAAVTDLNTQGVGSGGVTFNVAAGFWEKAANITITTTTSSLLNPIVFQKSGLGNNPVITAGTGTSTTVDGIIKIAGTDYITFDGIDVRDTVTNGTTTTRMEWGYAIVKGSATNGTQYVTIKNCKISLFRGAQSTATVGIYSGNHLSTSTTSLTVTSFAGTNSSNSFYNNTIDSAYVGISLNGYGDVTTPYNNYDHYNRVGADGANIIRNYGGSTSTAYGFYGIYQDSLILANNTITGGLGTTTTLYGAYFSTGTNSNLYVYGNTFTDTTSSTTSDVRVIGLTMGSSGTNNSVNIYNNTITGIKRIGVTSGVTYFIYAAASPYTLNIYNNTINNNVIGDNTTTNTGAIYGVYISTGTSTSGAVWSVYNNSIKNLTKLQSTVGAGAFYGYYATATSPTYNVYGDTVYNVSISSSTSTVNSIYYTAPTNLSTTNIYGNVIRKVAKIGGIGSNYASNYGIYGSMASSTLTANVYNNTLDSLSNTQRGQINCIYVTGSNASLATNFYGNTVSNISTRKSAIFGIYSSSGLTNKIYNNNLYNFYAGGDSGSVYGYCAFTTTSTSANTYLYNNYLSDFKVDSANTFLSAGLYLATSTACNILAAYNTVYLDNTPATGRSPQIAGIYANTAPTVDLRNNIVVNNSTGTGYTIGYQRTSTTLTTYSNNSNNNLFYVSSPSANRIVYFDGTNADQTLSAYKTRVSPRDANSVTEVPPFINVTTKPYDLHINTTVSTFCESGGTPVTSPLAINTDFDGDSRNGTTPDIGADEFSGLILNPPPTITYTPLLNTSSTSDRTLTATITDLDGVPTSGLGLPVLYWKINSGFYSAATGTFVSGNTYSFNFGAGVSIGDVVSYYIVAQDSYLTPNVGAYPSTGASGFTANPPACSTPPTNPSTYSISNSALSGDYTVGASVFNKITGKNITFSKVVKKVMVEETIEDKKIENNNAQTKDEKGKQEKGKQEQNNIEKSTSSKIKGNTRMVEVEKIEWIPMENGKEYKGDLFVKKNQNPGLNYPNGVNGVYLTITAAISDLNLRGVSGATRFLLVDASYTTGETYPLNVNIANEYNTTAVNTVTIKPYNGITASISGASASGPIFKIQNSYVTIDGSNSIGGTSRDLSITNTSATSPQVVSFLSSGTTPIVGSGIKNCTITNGANTSSAVVLTDASGAAGYFNNMTIQNNIIQLAYIGIFMNAALTGTNGNGTVIANNNLNSSGTNALRLVGIYVQGAYGITINNNNISNITSAVAETAKGIWLATGTNNCTVSNNSITNLSNTSAGSTYGGPIGIYVSTGVASSNINVSTNTISGITSNMQASNIEAGINVTGTTGVVTIQRNTISNIKNTNTGGYSACGILIGSSLTTASINVQNNFIYDVAGYGWSSQTTDNGYGINLLSGGGYNVYNNSVYLSTNQTYTTGYPACLIISSGITTANCLDIRNNIFMNTETVGTDRYCVISNAANTVFSNINYNDYYTTASNLGYIGSTNRANLAAWQTGTGKDANSVSGDPKFLGISNLHIDPTATTPVSNAGTPIAAVTNDIDGESRNATTPDIGADEYSYIPPAVEDPTGLTVVANSSSQITLSWTNNLNNDNVMVAYNSSNTFGVPDPFLPLNPGDPITGGGTVLFVGPDGNFSHTGLTENTTYYYKVWSVDPSYQYSTGVTGNATTLCGNKTLPYTQGFNSTAIPGCWTSQNVVGTSAIQFVASSSNPTTTPQEGSQYVFWNSFNSGWPSGNETRLVTPRITTTGTASVDVKFYWFNENNTSYNSGSYLLEGVQVQYSLDGTTWVDAGALVTRHDGTLTAGSGQWKLKTITLPAGAGNQSSIYVGLKFHSSYGDNCSLDNLTILETPTIIDVGPYAINQTGTVFYKNGTTNIPMTGVVKNYGTTTESFVVTRTISGTGYSSTQTVTSLGAGLTANVTFADFTGFSSGTSYTIKDSTYLATDAVANNDTLSKVFTPNIAKVNCVYWGDAASRDSLIACMTNAGMTSDDYDVLSTASYTGSLRVWSTVWVLFASGANWTSAQRDTMKAFLDNSDVSWKKTLVVFGNDLGYNHDRAGSSYTTTADSTFYRYYLKSRYIGDSWIGLTPSPNGKFKGSPDYTFPAIISDSCYDPYPDYVLPVNGGASAFIPLNRVNNNDTVNAVYYAGTTWNMFYGTNIFSGYRTKADGGKNPTSVFYVIMNWINMVGGTLPVEMTAFNSSVIKNNVTLKWTTATETNNKGFDIERKAANGNWVKAGNLQGSHTKTTPTNYTFEDKKLNAGKYSYRLKQIDVNGNYRYFNLNSVVEVGVPKSFSLSQNYPNPFNPVTKIDFELPFDSKVKMVLYDILGREVKVLVPNELKQAGFYTLEINALNLASGTYFYRMVANSQNKDYVLTKKMVIVK